MAKPLTINDTVYVVTISCGNLKDNSQKITLSGIFKSTEFNINEENIINTFYSKGVFYSNDYSGVFRTLVTPKVKYSYDPLFPLNQGYVSDDTLQLNELYDFTKGYGSYEKFLDTIVHTKEKYYKFIVRKLFAEYVVYDFPKKELFADDSEKEFIKQYDVNYYAYIKKIYHSYKVKQIVINIE